MTGRAEEKDTTYTVSLYGRGDVLASGYEYPIDKIIRQWKGCKFILREGQQGVRFRDQKNKVVIISGMFVIEEEA